MSNIVKNPAMVLQELTIKKGLSPPHYEIIASISGTHENRFDYRVRVCDVEAIGTGTSKQIGKHDAAYKALKLLEQAGIYDPKEIPMQEFKASVIQKQAGLGTGSGSPLHGSVNCIGPLKDICAENKIENPVFRELSDVGPPHCREFTYECCIGSVKTVAIGSTKKMAKQLAAKDMLEKLKIILPDLILEAPRRNEDLQSLPPSEKTLEVLEMYNELFGTVISDKKVRVEDFPYVFNKLMTEFEKTREDFIADLSEQTEESLVRILKHIELEHSTFVLQKDEPCIITLCINCDVPFAVTALGDTIEEAKEEVILQTFMMLDSFIQA